MTSGNTQTQFWDWRFFAIAMLLMAPEASLDRREIVASTFTDTTLPIPSPGQTVIFSVFNPSYGHTVGDKFGLTFSFAGYPKNKNEMFDLKPTKCNYYIGEMKNDKSIKFTQKLFLESPFENVNNHEVGFSSKNFTLRPDQSYIVLKNTGCEEGSQFSGGKVKITQHGEHLLIYLGAALLRIIGWILAIFGLGLGLFRFVIARRKG